MLYCFKYIFVKNYHKKNMSFTFKIFKSGYPSNSFSLKRVLTTICKPGVAIVGSLKHCSKK